MKTLFIYINLLLLSIAGYGQATVNLFNVKAVEAVPVEYGLIGTHTFLDLNIWEWEALLNEHPRMLSLDIPYNGSTLKLNLTKAKLFKDEMRLRTASGALIDLRTESKSVYYQGFFEGHPRSHFALSILNNEVIGLGSIPSIGDVNLGKVAGEDYYVFAPEKSLSQGNSFLCHTTEEPEKKERTPDSRAIYEDCTGLYFEVDYDIFLAKGGVLEASDYINALFNEIQILYQVDDMTVYISDMLVWDEESPYFGIADTGILLDLFGTTTVVWEGDLGHLVTNSASGGLAWVDVFCAGDQAIRKAVSGIGLDFSPIPVYSWSVEVVAHELGHNMGSPHTHACFWNGDDTAIDGCGPDAGFDEGCAGDLPPEGGTVMSYCHLTDVGIDLGLGFGEQPGDLMRNNIIESDCLEGCDLTEMDVQILSQYISPACEQGPITRSFSFMNNGNENLTSFTLNVLLEGSIVETHTWTGLVPVGGTGSFTLPLTYLDLGSYSMQFVVVAPNGYDDEEPADNSFVLTFEVTPYPIADFEPTPNQLISLDATAQMENFSNGAVTYDWDMGDGSPRLTGFSPTHTFPFEKGGNYTITLIAETDKGCTDTAKAFVYVEGINIYYIPNTFTPQSNQNDKFVPVFSAGLDIYDYHFTIFNRYGELIFESYNVAYGWNGFYGDKLADDGVYVWKLEFGDLTSDEKHVETGTVTLLR
jgi:gliding motility-associated-like protein